MDPSTPIPQQHASQPPPQTNNGSFQNSLHFQAPYPSQWPSEMSFAPSSIQAAQAAAFASYFRQHLLAQNQPPNPNPLSGGVSNLESPSVQFPSNVESQSSLTQTTTQTTQGTNRKEPNWKVNEDVALCQSWLRVLEDPIVGNGQLHKAFWKSIWDEFKGRLPGSERVQRACENRWTTIQADVSKWRAIVNRVHRNRSSGTNPNDEWGACTVVFKKDHKRDFKFLHCWEELRHCTKWHSTTNEKEARGVSRQGRVGTNQARNPNISTQGRVGTIFDTCRPGLDSIGLDSIDYSSNNPNISAADSTTDAPFNVDENPPNSFHSDAPIQRPLGRKLAKEKRRRSGAGVSEASSTTSERLNATVSAWRVSSESRFESLKQTAEEQAFHVKKNAKLDSVKKCITITKELMVAEKELLLLDPNLSADEVLAKRIARMRELEALDREHKEIRALEYSPGGTGRRRSNEDGIRLSPRNHQNSFYDENCFQDEV